MNFILLFISLNDINYLFSFDFLYEKLYILKKMDKIKIIFSRTSLIFLHQFYFFLIIIFSLTFI